MAAHPTRRQPSQPYVLPAIVITLLLVVAALLLIPRCKTACQSSSLPSTLPGSLYAYEDEDEASTQRLLSSLATSQCDGLKDTLLQAAAVAASASAATAAGAAAGAAGGNKAGGQQGSSAASAVSPPPPSLEEIAREEDIIAIAAKSSSVDARSIWYADRPYHGPPLLPLCSVDACFDFSLCDRAGGRGSSQLHPPKVYAYWSGPNYFQAFEQSRWFTSNPQEACFFFVFMASGQPKDFSDLPHWGTEGRNHVLISFSDSWSGPPPFSVGKAMLMLSAARSSVLRPSFDSSLPLPRKWLNPPPDLRGTPSSKRKYLLTFMGTRYLGPMPGNFRSTDAFRSLHNGRDVIVVSHCGGTTNRNILDRSPSHHRLQAQCSQDVEKYRKYSYPDTMNTTFALTPAGRQSSTYRFLEALSVGAIPVVVADNWKLPFDDIILWHHCLLSFPTSEINRVLPALRAMRPSEIERRRLACLKIFDSHLSTDKQLLESAMASLLSHFRGMLPYAPMERNEE